MISGKEACMAQANKGKGWHGDSEGHRRAGKMGGQARKIKRTTP